MKKYFIEKDSSEEHEVNIQEIIFNRENLTIKHNSYSLCSEETFYQIFENQINEEINEKIYEDWKDDVANDNTKYGYEDYHDRYYGSYYDYNLRDYEMYFQGESNIGYFYDGNLSISSIDFYEDLKKCEKIAYNVYKFQTIEEYNDFFKKIDFLYVDFDKCIEIADAFLNEDEDTYEAFFSKSKIKKLMLK
jgi:hypothetical protein